MASSSKSWVEIDPTSDFSLDNIPFGVFSRPNDDASADSTPRCGTAIGSYAVDLSLLAMAGLFSSIPQFGPKAVYVFSQPTLNEFMSHPKSCWIDVRDRLIELFSTSSSGELQHNTALREAALIPLSSVKMHLPATVGDYTDFYSSIYHATNVGTMFRGKDNALQPNWKHLPVGYHGRSSSVYVSGTDVVRPHGQLQIDPVDPHKGSTYGPCKLLDYELEMAFFVGGPPKQGTITMDEADSYIFGYVLMNDWSARDIQKWEYVPLGPFTSKNFATSISPWIITPMALAPYKCPPTNGAQDQPKPLEYLRDDTYEMEGAYDIKLQVSIQTPAAGGGSGDHDHKQPEIVTTSNFKHLYWNSKQQLVHHAVTGCPMKPGDLLGTGTISGPEDTSLGCMLELCWKGTRIVKLGESGEERKFLKDGDTVIMEGYCPTTNGGGGLGRVGFGNCIGKVLPASAPPPAPAPSPPPSSVSSCTTSHHHRYTNIKLYGYWLSSASWRVRIVLASKSIPYESKSIQLLKGEQHTEDHTHRNPMEQVPVLECVDAQTGEVVRVSQSMAIIDFLEDAFYDIGGTVYPATATGGGGGDPTIRARAREMAEIVNSGIQPLQNQMLVKKIEEESNGSIKGQEFAQRAITKGLHALERLVVMGRAEGKGGSGGGGGGTGGGPHACGTFHPTIADVCLVPQLFNARRFGVDVKVVCPTLLDVERVCVTHPWFVKAHPFEQSDAVPDVVEKLKALIG